MITVQTNTGQVYQAQDERELVAFLHEASMAPAEDDAAFMRQTAERTVTQTGDPIRTGTPAEFVGDLIKTGLLKVVQPS